MLWMAAAFNFMSDGGMSIPATHSESMPVAPELAKPAAAPQAARQSQRTAAQIVGDSAEGSTESVPGQGGFQQPGRGSGRSVLPSPLQFLQSILVIWWQVWTSGHGPIGPEARVTGVEVKRGLS